MITNACYKLCLKKLRTLETYKIQNEEQYRSNPTTTKVRKIIGTTQGQGTKVLKLKNSRMLGNTLIMSKVTHDLPPSRAF